VTTLESEAIVIRQHGGPEVLRLEDVEVGDPGPGELRVRQTAAGVNFHDVYVRTGSYHTLTPPGIPGCEAVGVVEALGDGVTNFSIGQRIVYLTPKYGGYAAARVLPAAVAVALPDGIDDVAAASVWLKGLTACMLLRRVHSVQAGDHLLVHAAAGAVGQLLCAWGSHLGAHVIGTAGSEAKAETARACGAEEVILYRTEDVAARVAEITDGKGVAAAYDSVGRDTFPASLASLGLFGHLVNFGQASGFPDPIAPNALSPKSNSLTFPVIFHFVRQRPSLETMAAELFDVIAEGVVTPQTDLRLPLKDAAEAHRALEERRTTGAIVMTP
jgi:NADPH2:quinone reductase